MSYLWTKLLKHRFTDLEFHPIEFRYLFFSGFLLKKNNTSRVSSSNFLLILTKFYMFNLLYRVLHFFFVVVDIIQHTSPKYNFLFFSLRTCFYTINYVLWIFPKTIGGWSKAFFIFSYNNTWSIWVTNVTTVINFIHCYLFYGLLLVIKFY